MLGFSKSKSKNGKKILIVEDELTLRKAIKKKLEKEGFKVFEAVNGAKGLDLALQKNQI